MVRENKRSAGGLPQGAPGRLGVRLTGRLALLAASMRAAGARVGIDELLGAHRALAAVDPADRSAAYFALRATLCSRRDDLAAFDAAFAELFAAPLRSAAGATRAARRRGVARAAATWPCRARRCAVPQDAEVEVRARGVVGRRAPPRQGLRRLHGRGAAAGARADPADRGRGPHPPEPAHAPRPAARRTASRGAPGPAPDDPLVAAHGRRPVRAPLARARRAAAPARARLRRVRLDGALRAHAAPVHAGVRGRAPPRGGVRVRHAAHSRDGRARRPRPRPRARARRGSGRATGRAARASARRSRRSTASTAAASVAARSWCCSPTAGTVATPSSSRRRWRASSAARTSSSG